MLLGPSWDRCANIHNRRPPVYDELLSRLSNSQRANGRPVDVFLHDCNTFRHSTREFSQLLTLRRPVFPLEAFMLFYDPYGIPYRVPWYLLSLLHPAVTADHDPLLLLLVRYIDHRQVVRTILIADVI